MLYLDEPAVGPTVRVRATGRPKGLFSLRAVHELIVAQQCSYHQLIYVVMLIIWRQNFKFNYYYHQHYSDIFCRCFDELGS